MRLTMTNAPILTKAFDYSKDAAYPSVHWLMEQSDGRTEFRMRRAGDRHWRVGHGERGDRGIAGLESTGRREGSPLWRHDGPIGWLVVDPGDAARYRAGHHRARRCCAHLPAA